MNLKDSYHPYAALTIIFWSLAYVLLRMTLRYFSAFSLGFLRYFTASCVLLAMVFAMKIKAPKKSDLKWFLGSGFFGFFLYMTTYNTGCKTVTAATGSVVISTAPVLTALIARVIYQEKLRGFQLVAMVIEFTGVVVLMQMKHAFSLNSGLFWLLIAAFSFAAFNLLQRKLAKTYTGLQTSVYSIFAGTAMLAIFLPVSVKEVLNAPPVQLVYIAVLGILASAVPYATWAQAMKKAKQTSYVSNYMFFTPLCTALIGFILAGETLDSATIVGGAIILMGVTVFNFGGLLHDWLLPEKNAIRGIEK